MDKQMLKCDICGGVLKMQANREAVCENCGMAYSIESLREKFNGLKISVTGSNEDVQQWRTLLQTYIYNCDYSAAETIVKKILEAVPNDSEALETYNNLQEWKYFDVRNGVLVGYSGAASVLNIPVGVKEIQRALFQGKFPSFSSIIFPRGFMKIGDCAFFGVHGITDISLPAGVVIESGAFAGTGIKELDIPEGAVVKGTAFNGCRELKKIMLHEDAGIVSLSEEAFYGCTALDTITTSSTDYDDVGRYVVVEPKSDWNHFAKTRQVLPPDGIRRESPQSIEVRKKREEAFEQRRKQWKDNRDKGLCVYCGGGSLRGYSKNTV